jgi:putative peptidoglycan lipid II flippase
VPRSRVVPALGLGTSIGLTVSGVVLLVLVARVCGAASLAGVLRAFLAGLTGCAAAAAAGSVVAALLRASGFFPNVGISILVCAVVTGVFAAIVLNVDGGDLRAAVGRLRTRVPVPGQ